MPQFSLLNGRSLAMGLAHLFMNVYIFALLPIAHQRLMSLGCAPWLYAVAVGAFSIGMFAPGAMGAYLVERYSRKAVFIRAMFVLSFLGSAAFVVFSHPSLIIATMACQGAAYGLAQTSLGATLVNDLTPTTCRTRANNAYAWYGRLGLPLGLFAGVNIPLWLNAEHAVSPFIAERGFPETMLILALVGFAAILFVTSIHVPVKAPIKVQLLTLDRFFLPAVMKHTLPSMLTGFNLGVIVAYDMHSRGWIFLALGMLLTLAIPARLRSMACMRNIPIVGLLLSLVATLLLASPLTLHTPALATDLLTDNALRSAFFLILGIGSALTLERTLFNIVEYAAHCQRGTAQSTYFLTFAFAFGAGLALFTLI